MKNILLRLTFVITSPIFVLLSILINILGLIFSPIIRVCHYIFTGEDYPQVYIQCDIENVVRKIDLRRYIK